MAGESPFYSGKFRVSGLGATLVGSMHDRSPWDHLDYAGKHLIPVTGTIQIDMDERAKTGRMITEYTGGGSA